MVLRLCLLLRGTSFQSLGFLLQQNLGFPISTFEPWSSSRNTKTESFDSHLSRSFASTLISPAQDSTHMGSFIHLPLLRLPAQGAPWVSLFFLLTGYVNAVKPIKQAQSGNGSQALSGLAFSAFRRTGRLVLPATIATVISWMICQLGLFEIGRTCDAAWIRDTSPTSGPGFTGSIRRLFTNLFTTWTTGFNDYDRNQWTFPFLLKGSMLIFITLLATIRIHSNYRILVFFGLYAFSWAAEDCKRIFPSPTPSSIKVVVTG